MKKRDTIRTQAKTKQFVDLVGNSKRLLDELKAIDDRNIKEIQAEEDPIDDIFEANAPNLDKEQQGFAERKRTIVRNIEEIAEKRFADDTDKREEFIKEMTSALDEEQQVYNHIRRATVERRIKKYTPEELKE